MYRGMVPGTPTGLQHRCVLSLHGGGRESPSWSSWRNWLCLIQVLKPKPRIVLCYYSLMSKHNFFKWTYLRIEHRVLNVKNGFPGLVCFHFGEETIKYAIIKKNKVVYCGDKLLPGYIKVMLQQNSFWTDVNVNEKADVNLLIVVSD